jgi:hypothetical protein
MTTQEQITKRFHVTDAQLDAVAYFTDEATQTPLFKVLDDTTEYTVTWNVQDNRPQCGCDKAAEPGYCWHARAALAVLTIHVQAKRDEAEATRLMELAQADADAEREYLMSLPDYQPSERDVRAAQRQFQPKPFSLLR